MPSAPRFDSAENASAFYRVQLRSQMEQCSTSGFTLLKDLFDLAADLAGQEPLQVAEGEFRSEDQLREAYLRLYPTVNGDNAVAWDDYHLTLLEAVLRRLNQPQYAAAVEMDRSRQEISPDTLKALIWVVGYGPRLVAGDGEVVPIGNITLPDVTPLPRFGAVINPPPGGTQASVSCQVVDPEVTPWKAPVIAWEGIPKWILILAGIIAVAATATVVVLYIRGVNEEKKRLAQENKPEEAAP